MWRRAVPWCLALATLAGFPSLARAEEVRESYDAQGRLTRSMTLSGTTVLEETVYVYDDEGRVKEKATTKDGKVYKEVRTYDEGGKLIKSEQLLDGVSVGTQVNAYDKDDALERSQATNDKQESRTTTLTRDPYGNVILKEVKDGTGQVVSRVVSEYAHPISPIKVTLDAGGGYQSDVELTNVSLGFGVARKPPLELFGADPLELRVSGAFNYGRKGQTIINNQMLAGFGVDYNFLFPRTTFFIFGSVERNPAAHTDIDVELAPIGAKFDLIYPRNPWVIDMSFAPVWQYQTLCSPDDAKLAAAQEAGEIIDGDPCLDVESPYRTTSTAQTLRGSMRLRVRYRGENFSLGTTVEFLPDLKPVQGTIVDQLLPQAIFRSTTGLEVKLTGHLSLKEDFKFEQDPSYADKFSDRCQGEGADPSLLICSNRAITTTTTLSFRFDFKR